MQCCLFNKASGPGCLQARRRRLRIPLRFPWVSLPRAAEKKRLRSAEPLQGSQWGAQLKAQVRVPLVLTVTVDVALVLVEVLERQRTPEARAAPQLATTVPPESCPVH